MAKSNQSGKRGRGRIIALAAVFGASGLVNAQAAGADPVDEPGTLEYLLNLADERVPVAFSNEGEAGQRLAAEGDNPHHGNEVVAVTPKNYSHYASQNWVLERTRHSKDGYFVIRNLHRKDASKPFTCLQPHTLQDPSQNSMVRVRNCSDSPSKAESWKLEYDKRRDSYTLRPGANTGFVAAAEVPHNNWTWVKLYSANSYGSGARWELRES